MEITCMIIDDEPLAIALLEGYVAKIPFLRLVGSYDNPLEALEAYTAMPVNLIFLDIQMPELNGLELSKIITPATRIVFTTAFKQYAFESYAINAIDYLLKPIGFQVFLRASNKALQWFELNRKQTSSLTTAEVTNKENGTIFVRSDHRLIQIDLKNILYISGLRDYVKIYTVGSTRSIISLMTLKSAEELLPTDRFVRVHRSYIVAIDKINSIENNRVIIGKEYIPVSDAYREKFNLMLSSRLLGKK
ncbi:LytTR family DNA-binding domain-containing protein [Parabacteroides sp. PF5-9]|uniref:LytR/AlgR family response regulator transcription factor n=1 Tax=Parabacteroides sp. PF5-9 TaxID=1742404 RepID=UPI0024762F32|nr:LytTR family DNA-binding domain-containing protein [Parabacteroides sp. PF5-9]MDH6356567.1 two-component system LytT family response regulator [Parabacteroides sp. PF5-9]